MLNTFVKALFVGLVVYVTAAQAYQISSATPKILQAE